MKDWVLTLIMIIGFIFMFLAVALLFFYFKSNGVSCINDPLKYYQNISNSVCYCTKLDMNNIHNIKW